MERLSRECALTLAAYRRGDQARPTLALLNPADDYFDLSGGTRPSAEETVTDTRHEVVKLTGGTVPSDHAIDGKDIWPLVRLEGVTLSAE